MITSKQIFHYYEHFYSITSGMRNFTYTPNERDIKTTENFLKELDKEYQLNSISEQFLFDYISFQFSLKHDQKTRFGVGNILFNHVIGKKSLEQWKNRSEYWEFHRNNYLEKFNIKKGDFIKEVKEETKDWQNKERGLYYNTYKGFNNCIENTTLFDNKSKYCVTCNYKKDCEVILKKTYPEIYKNRIK